MPNLTLEKKPLLSVRNLKKYYRVRSALGKPTGFIKAVDNISFDIYEGETYGLVGESGCGKSTAGRSLLQLVAPTDGEVRFNGIDILKFKGSKLRDIRKNIQMIFQDPHTSLDPRKKIGYTIEETLKIHRIGNKKERKELALTLLKKVGFKEEHYNRYPHEFSDGQRQRIGIIRSLVLNPKLIICDEPVSALDVSIQAQIINLLKTLQTEMKLSYLSIAHDLSVVRRIADRVGVMYLGNIVEQAPTEELYTQPLHPYTQLLLSSIPSLNPSDTQETLTIKGEIPSPLNPPTGCVFHTRCPFALDRCKHERPSNITIGNRTVNCHLYDSETTA